MGEIDPVRGRGGLATGVGKGVTTDDTEGERFMPRPE